MITDQLIVRDLGLQPYEPIWQKMQQFTNERDETAVDEIWLLQHEPVFTQGQAGKEEHVLNTGDIPIVQVDRGGQVTYHGPGQLIVYLLLNLKRLKVGVRELVSIMEDSVVETVQSYGVDAYAKPDAPGVYVDESKIASLGLRVRRGCSFHGLALNLDMDLEPFLRINPCGYAGMAMTQLAMLSDNLDQAEATERLLNFLINKIGYSEITRQNSLD
ncbi:lipoyl(octanoyl) transferase LipB [Neptuniibacter sp.]|uniref:lipoyl(octanoyl) transferase LipB n=1 Tax=Neptuniibacter sp. TaxID=1962643 RepID=UPI00262EA5CE|nr:lipoyl(octanoyl) transferase LipB [Neptuniibacter sp.]MCP4598468.1 lipoyl(octanoyl) transferase LipB [Neptuniibacter sp.]